MGSMGSLTIRSRQVLAFLGAVAFILAACGGGGGGGSNGRSDPGNVTITGTVTDGSGASSPVPGAACEYVDAADQQYDTDICDPNGTYELGVPPGLNGYIRCGPQSMPSLNLTTFSSTVDYTAGQLKDSENITPTTTVVADIIRYEKPSDPEARKAELVLQARQDPDLATVAAMAGRLFRAMLAQQVDAQFGDDRRGGGDGGGGDGDGGGGVGGDAGDGADFSPLPGAECGYVLDDVTKDEPLAAAAMADLLDDGELNRPDLAALSGIVMSGVTQSSEEIRQAFETWFPDGLGDRLTTVTNSEGTYFLPVPPNLAGYVRCTPQGRNKMVLGTYVAGRQAGERLVGQNVTPATTVFSTVIAPQFQEGLPGIKENFLDDIEGLVVRLDGLPDGPLDGIRLDTATGPSNSEVGLVAFSAVALFNALLKNDLDVDFPAAISDLFENQAVEQAFLEAQGLSVAEAQEIIRLVNPAISSAETELGVRLGPALNTARVKLTVVNAADGSAVTGAAVAIVNDTSCSGSACQYTTDSNGQVTLTLSGVSADGTDIEISVSAEPNYAPALITARVAAFATVDVTVTLSSITGGLGTISGAVLDALTDTPLGGVRVAVLEDGQEAAAATTDAQGNFSVQVAPGTGYSITFEIDGYLPTRYDDVAVSAAETTFLETTLQVSAANSGTGGITGTIRNAVNNEGIAGVALQLREGINNLSGPVTASTTSDTSGGYGFSDIPAGVYTLSLSHSDYLDTAFTVISVGGETRNGQDGSMSPQLGAGSVRIVLTWGATPSDLDAHTFGPASSGGTFHCYYNDRIPDPGYVNLDLDDTDGNGPETTTIEQRLSGTYRFEVYDYSNRNSTTSNALSLSGAQVTVYGDSGEIAAYNVPSGQGGTVWTVFELDGDTGAITPRNIMDYSAMSAVAAAQLQTAEKE